MEDQKRILVAPLDWGLGHAARCIPLILHLLARGVKVLVAADNRPLALLKAELREYDIEFLRFPGYNINYPVKGSMGLKMLRSAPRILRGIREEHSTLRELIKRHNIQAVISDNRFGLWTKEVPCIFITHQLMIKSPFGEKLLHMLNSGYIGRYDECWIPDMEGDDNFSGDLSHKYPLPVNAHYVGLLTRFENHAGNAPLRHLYDVVAIISGPEPQRSLFAELVTRQAKNASLRALIVGGTPERGMDKTFSGSIVTVSHLDTGELHNAILSAPVVLSRPGYSTVMDLAALGRKAIFVPTPGQTEQEYLGGLLMKKGIAYCVEQDRFDLLKALNESVKYSGFSKMINTGDYKNRIDALLERL